MTIFEVKYLKEDFIERLINGTDECYKLSEVARERQLSNLKNRCRIVDLVSVGKTSI